MNQRLAANGKPLPLMTLIARINTDRKGLDREGRKGRKGAFALHCRQERPIAAHKRYDQCRSAFISGEVLLFGYLLIANCSTALASVAAGAGLENSSPSSSTLVHFRAMVSRK